MTSFPHFNYKASASALPLRSGIPASHLNPNTQVDERNGQQLTSDLPDLPDLPDLIDRPINWPKIGKRQFAHRHLATHLDLTSLEGTFSKASITYWKSLFDMWKTGEGQFLKVDISPQQFQILEEIIEEYDEFLKMIEELRSSPELSDYGSKIENILALIEKSCRKRGYCYFPLGYQGSISSEGHAIPLLIRLEDQVITHFLNLGRGVSSHPVLEWDGTENSFHFRYFPIEFSKHDFFGKIGKELFSRLLQLEIKKPPNEYSYTSEDVYGPFKLLGKTRGSFTTPPSLREKKPQIGPTCGDKAIELIMRDFLLDQGCSKSSIKRFFCDERLLSLVSFYHETKEIKDLESLTMLRLAIEELTIHIHNFPADLLSASENLTCETILSLLKQRISLFQDKLTKKSLRVPPLLNIAPSEWTLSEAFSPPTLRKAQLKTKLSQQPSQLPFSSLEIPPFVPSEFGSTLNDWTELYTEIKLSSSSAADYLLTRMMLSLPTPTHTKNDLWNLIPHVQIPSLIENFTLLLVTAYQTTLASSQNESATASIRLILHLGFAIVDKLCRRIDPRLKHFIPFCPLVMETESMDTPLCDLRKSFFPFGEESQKCEAVYDYFFELLYTTKHSFFAFQKKINIELALKKNEGEIETPEASHVRFLLQYCEESFGKGLQHVGSRERQIAELWCNSSKNYLPSYLEHLERIAYLCAESLYGQNKSNSYAPQLKKEVLVNQGTFVLMPECADFPSSPDHRLVISYPYSSTDSQHRKKLEKELFEFKRTSNQALTLPKHSDWESEKSYREWVRIFANPGLQVAATLTWMQKNVHLLTRPVFRQCIEMAFFTSDSLRKALESEPSLVENLRHRITEGMNFYRETNKGAYLFLVRLGICCESHIAAALNREIDLKRLGVYEEELVSNVETTPQRSYWGTLLLIHRYGLPKKNSSLAVCIAASFYLKYHPPSLTSSDSSESIHKLSSAASYDPIWIYHQTSDLYRRYHKETLEAMKEPEWVASLRSFIFELLKIEDQESISLDILNLKLIRNESSLEFVPEMESSLCWTDPKEHLYLSLNGKERVRKVASNTSLREKLFPEISQETWYTHVPTQELERVNPSFSTNFSSSVTQCWINAEPNSHSPLIIEEEKRQFYLVNHPTQGMRVEVYNQPEKKEVLLLYQKEKATLEHLYYFFSFRLGCSPSDLRIFIDPEQQRITSLRILPLALTFEGGFFENRWVLKCSELKGYYISEEQLIETTSHFHGALILENEIGKKIALIPMHLLEPVQTDFSMDAKFTTPSPLHYPKEYYLYSIDPERNLLISENSMANTQLVFLFAYKREYPRALEYLMRSSSYANDKSVESDHYIHFLQRNTDQSSAGIAFSLRIGLHLFENQNQLLESLYNPEEKRKKQALLNRIAKALFHPYYRYLRHLSTHLASRLPGELILSHSAEKLLISFLLEHLKKTSGYYDRFEFRKKILEAESATHHSTSTKNHTLYPLSLRQMSSGSTDLTDLLPYANQFGYLSLTVPSPLPFVRLTFSDFLYRFPEFYKKSQLNLFNDLDFFYLAQSFYQSPHEATMKKFLLILNTVRKFPKTFENLQLDPGHPETFPQILNLCNPSIKKFFRQDATTINDLAEVRFSYSKSYSLILPKPLPPQPASFTFTQVERDTLKETADKEIQILLSRHFEPSSRTSSPDGRPFLPANLVDTTPTERELTTALKEGFVAYRKKLDSVRPLILKSSSSESQLIEDAKTLIKKQKAHAETLKKRAETLANEVPDYTVSQSAQRALNWSVTLRKLGGNLPWIQMDGILTRAFIKRDPLILQQANPSLNASQLKALFLLTAEYHVTLVSIERLEQGLSSLLQKKEGALKHFAQLCETSIFFDALARPELVVFSSRKKMLYRQNQINLLNWHFNTKTARRVISFPAGGGKTDLYQPIAIETALNAGKSVVIFSLNNQLPLDREKLKNALYFSFHEKHATWELKIDTKLELEDLETMYVGLKRCIEQHIPLHTTPITYYSALLQSRLALEYKDEEKVRCWNKIFDLFSDEKKPTLALFEESRQSLAPSSQAKLGIGKLHTVSKTEQLLLLEIYRFLVFSPLTLRDGRPVSSILKLTSPEYAETATSDLEEIRSLLAQELVKSPLLGLNEGNEDLVLSYLQTPTLSRPSLIATLHTASMIDLAQRYLWDFFEKVIRISNNVQHKSASKDYAEFDTPAHRGLSTGAYYENPYVSIILSIQGLLNRGLTQMQCATLAEKALRLHQLSLKDPLITSPEMLLEQCTGEKGVFAREIESIGELILKNKNNHQLLFWYLEHVVLDQVTYTKEQIEASQKHLINGFAESISFSATPGPLEIYGLYTEKEKNESFYSDPTFAPAVIHQMNAPQNGRIYRTKTTITTQSEIDNPIDFFKELYSLDPAIFDRLSLITDAGGIFRNIPRGSIIVGFLNFLKEMKDKVHYDGIITFAYWKVPNELVYVDLHQRKISPLVGGDIVYSLASCGYNWDTLKILTVCPLSEIIGFNPPIRKGGLSLITAGENLPQSDAIQALNRPRDFLDGHEVGWIVPESLATKLEERYKQPCSPALFTQWIKKNEGLKIEDEILSDAFLEIDYLMETPFRKALKEASKDPKLQIRLWHKHREGVVKSPSFLKPLEPMKHEESETLLKNYATQAFQSYKYSISSWEQIPEIKNRMNDLIVSAKSRIERISTRSSSQILAQTHVHTHQNADRLQETHGVQLIQPEPSKPLKFPDFNRSGLIHALIRLTKPAQAAFSSRGLSPQLFISDDALKTAQIKGVSLEIKYFKPIQFILCVRENEYFFAFAISDEEASSLQEKLSLLTSTTTAPHQLFLLNPEGMLVQNGKGVFGISNQEFSTLIQSDTLKNILVDINLLSQEVYDSKVLAKRLETWEDIWPLWTKIKEGFPFGLNSSQFIENLIPAKFKFKEPVPTPQKSWLSSLASSIFN